MQQIIKEKKNVFNPSCNDEVLVIELMVEFRYEIGSHARKIFGDEKFSTLSFHVFEAAAAGEICDQFKVDLWRLNSLLLNIVCIAYLDALNLKFFIKFFSRRK